ncbi:hypothetical protein SUGI_0734070 [Cryptomeria japonica]|nr:hypothetical protein SUGI_0734070 [Cryptomeria japonica]
MMESRWSLKEAVPCQITNKIRDRNLVRWKTPPEGWAKLNFDGTSKGNPGIEGFGALLRGDSREVISVVYGSLGEAMNNEAELRAMEAGLAICVDRGVSKIILEGDSQLIINGVANLKFNN